MESKLGLVVDDDAAIRKYVATVLQKNGFRTIQATNGEQALDLIREGPGSLTFLIANIQMPKLDGIKLARIVHSEAPHISIVLMSGAAPRDIHDLEFGIGSLQKPFRPATLPALIAKVLARRNPPRSGIKIKVS